MSYRTRVSDYIKVLGDSNVSESDLESYARGARDELIEICDWTQLSDNNLSVEKREIWSNYRQALRDLPNQPDFPKSIVWPTTPSKN